MPSRQSLQLLASAAATVIWLTQPTLQMHVMHMLCGQQTDHFDRLEIFGIVHVRYRCPGISCVRCNPCKFAFEIDGH